MSDSPGVWNTLATDRIFSQYCKEVSKTQILSPEEELRLYRLYKRKGDQAAKDRLVHNCLRTVVKLACQYSQDPDVAKDLISAGNIGILEALDRYDDTRNTRFLSYATYWIHLYIREEWHSKELVGLPRWRRKAIKKINEINDNCRAAGKEAKNDDLCAATKLSERQVKRLMNGVHKLSFSDAIEQIFNSPDYIQMFSERKARKIFSSLLQQLNERESFVVKAYFGMVTEPMTLRGMATMVGTSSERIRQIKLMALNRLRKLAEEMLHFGVILSDSLETLPEFVPHRPPQE